MRRTFTGIVVYILSSEISTSTSVLESEAAFCGVIGTILERKVVLETLRLTW